MKKAKKLMLSKKTVRELSNNELTTVVGGMTMLTKCVTTGDVPCHTAQSCLNTQCSMPPTDFVVCG